MSTTFDLRGLVAPPAEERPAVPPRQRAAGRRRSTSERARSTGKATALAGIARPVFLPLRHGAFRPGRAGFFACAVLVLSVLGMIYITQISRVARYGYRLSAVQQQQAKLDRENELLQNQIATERTLAQVSKLAGTEYRMQPLLDGARSAVTASAAPAAAATKTVASAGRNAPQIRFISAQRPRVTPAEVVAPGKALTLVDRLWNRLVGVGVARAAE